MYLGIFLVICMAVCMYRIAEYEKRRGWLWAWLCVMLIGLSNLVVNSIYIPPISGFVLTFMLMTLANIYRPVNKGPFSR